MLKNITTSDPIRMNHKEVLSTFLPDPDDWDLLRVAILFHAFPEKHIGLGISI